MTRRSRIFLCGFMGSGKSTLGKKTAALLNSPFIDLDAYIENQTGKSIPEIFKQAGETTFREIESDCVNQIISLYDSVFVSLGGGTVCSEKNLDLIKKSGLLIYLQLPNNALAKRLSDSKIKRPLLSSLDENDLSNFIESKMLERKPFYSQAHLTINALNLTPQQLHQYILDLL